jgi:hypothetical protein
VVVIAFRIENERLAVDIGEPGEYAGSRFDWTGFIRQVTLKGAQRHTFCIDESLIPGKGTGGTGLCGEFGIDRPVGYDEAKPGGTFPKIGIGLLTRQDEARYDFFRPYPVRPFPVRTAVSADAASFACEPLESDGYAVRLNKTLSLQGAELTIASMLQNTGSKPIATTEYVHNFTSIDGLPIGPDYELRFAAGLAPETDSFRTGGEWLEVGDRTVRWSRPVEGTFYARWEGFDRETPFYWELVNRKARAGIRERGDARGVKVAMWGEPHVVSPEVFVEISVLPGETLQWKRSYTFFEL